MGQITATRNLVATKVVRHAGQSIKVEIKGVNPTSTGIPKTEEIYDTIAWLPFSYAEQTTDVSNLAHCIWNDLVYWTQQSHQPL